MGMNDINSLSHSKWNCKYHIVFAMIFSITHHCINTIMESYFFICHCHLRKDQRAINRESICVIIGYEIILRPDNLPSR